MSQFITKMFYKQRDDFARSCIERDHNISPCLTELQSNPIFRILMMASVLTGLTYTARPEEITMCFLS